MIQPIELGKFRLYSLYDGTFRLDGGAMFGVVPWALWSRYAPPDELNRIRLGLRPLLVEAGDQWILIDTGMGDKFNEKLNKIYSIESKPQLVEQLNQIGVAVTDINIVINTHLHWDHAGGNTKREPSSDKWIPAFPNARYIVQQGEFEFATHPNERTRGSYRAEDFIALRDLGYFDFVDGNVGIANGVTVVRSGGHVPYHQCVLLESARGR